jgi:hypothetical protein
MKYRQTADNLTIGYFIIFTLHHYYHNQTKEEKNERAGWTHRIEEKGLQNFRWEILGKRPLVRSSL